jgi:tRNA(adenine34) deaminase
MALALAEAAAAAARGEVPVGAVLLDGAGEVVAADGNRTEELADPTAHAEMLVIRAAAQRAGRPRLPECDLYVTLEPCPMCAHAISLARLPRAAGSSTGRASSRAHRATIGPRSTAGSASVGRPSYCGASSPRAGADPRARAAAWSRYQR